MKIYEVDEGEFWAGNTAEEAAAAYIAECGADLQSMQEFGPPIEVPEEALDRFMVTDTDEPGQPSHSFRKALSELKAPGFIATQNL